MSKTVFTILLLSISFVYTLAQDDLLDILAEEQEADDPTVSSIFKGQRLINGHTVVTRKRTELEFIISHRFGRINTGIDEFFGLDRANVRFSLEYGVTDRITLGVGRNSFEKVYDGFLKYNLLEQQTSQFPVTITGFSSLAIRTADDFRFDNDNLDTKLSFIHQLLIARKLSDRVSVQFSPTYLHRRKVLDTQKNNIFALGMGGRTKLTSRIALNAEYYYRVTDEQAGFKDSFGIGMEIETGGHVFHLQFTNSRSMVERGFIAETDGDFFDGDIHFGFNISRVF